MTLHTLESELSYPHTRPHSGDKVSAEEIFSRALIGAETALTDRFYLRDLWPVLEFFNDKSEPHMKVIDMFLKPLLEEGLAKHAAQTKAGLADYEGKTLLDSLLRETTGWVTPKFHRRPSH